MDKKNSPGALSLKTQAKLLRQALAEEGIELGHVKALHAVARSHGYKNWNTARAVFQLPSETDLEETPPAESFAGFGFPENNGPKDFPVWDPNKFQLPSTHLTMDGAKALLNTKLVDIGNSTACPCCTRHVKMWKRKLYNSMVRWLMWIVQESDAEIARGNKEGWVNYEKGPRFQDYSKLQYWKLIEPLPHKPEEKGTAGVGRWRPTKLAREFVAGTVALPTHVYVYNNIVYGFTEVRITVYEALGKKFDYAELWSGEVPNFGFGKSKGKAKSAPKSDPVPETKSDDEDPDEEFDVNDLLNGLHDD